MEAFENEVYAASAEPYRPKLSSASLKQLTPAGITVKVLKLLNLHPYPSPWMIVPAKNIYN